MYRRKHRRKKTSYNTDILRFSKNFFTHYNDIDSKISYIYSPKDIVVKSFFRR